VHIEIGKTDGFHYLGVQPPSVMKGIDAYQLELPYAAYVTSTSTINIGRNNAYSDIGYDSSALSPKSADDASVETANRLAAMITESTGLSVEVRPQVKWIGFGKYLFGISSRD
ncbi:MAG: hypothetical protein ACREGB_03150, partial [Candidatus Saccharimonadales bacterium]